MLFQLEYEFHLGRGGTRKELERGFDWGWEVFLMDVCYVYTLKYNLGARGNRV